ncbi:M20/M25/M40 family metallo-hydrolase [Agromyces archimandritae]|uniref:M20/M25/M40 family metallo-hydrolase n=1 Tax=Agromyces archimandritae TaxID=2781962 RepID=A0A975FPE2_9MICO|nr:M20/M25/M40 family metallo-hydrolase [Agromyces archimandritae]QTX05859.1 M20/M25/M40 family metallo-hydrolase [Agromyces archimandritae]
MSVGAATGDEEVCRLTAELIRIDTTNRGGGDAEGERAAADRIEALLAEAGIHCRRYEREPGRTNLIARWAGTDPSLPAIVLHGHLDVVPADPAGWSVDPFGGVIRDGMLWGRGAVDMKNMVAMIVTAVRTLAAAGFVPRRDVILAFLADEEDNSRVGARWLAEAHPDAFAGADTAVSEVGGFSAELAGRPVFFLQTGEKGILWLRLTARGRASHASQRNPDNPVHRLARALARIADEDWPLTGSATSRALDAGLREVLGEAAPADPLDLIGLAGPAAAFIAPGLANVANATIVDAGANANVVPATASAIVDVRFVPGGRDAALARIRELAGPDVDVEIADEAPAVEAPATGPVVDAMRAAIRAHRPDAAVVPYLLPAGTDNAMLAGLGIRGYGFVPMLLPAGYDFPAMFHGVDERVPLDALVFGEAVLREFIRAL